MRTAEYTTPLQGTPYFRSVGIIKVTDKKDNQYNVAEIAFERFDDQNFQYVFSPYWGQIEALPPSIFSGIPGIDMDVQKEHYYRVNMTPSFISKRTPSQSREDVWELLEDVGLDYYDRFEWLLRTNMRCGDDNFIVVRKHDKAVTYEEPSAEEINLFQPGDKVVLNQLCDISTNRNDLSESMFRLFQSGVTIFVKEDNVVLTVEECRKNLYSLGRMMEYEKKVQALRQKEGIEKAKADGKYKGRKRISVDPLLFEETVNRFQQGLITEEEALKILQLSRSTFYRRIREKM